MIDERATAGAGIMPRMRHLRKTLLPLALVTMNSACATTTTTTSTTMTAGHAPTPYTASDIRLANPPGTTIVFRIEEPGKPPVRKTIRFVAADAEGCEVEDRVEGVDGASPEPPSRVTARWEELRDHALFPAATTRRSRERRTVAAGTFDCWLYEVEGQGDAAGTVSRFHFALDRPGPPVLFETVAGGNVVFRMEMVEDSRGM